ncbi:MAG: cation:proton antiporter, partial [Deltaproteobacteria bacterium]|nr:cation:proton antiporter [Deltaproteobacteria bacterium]
MSFLAWMALTGVVLLLLALASAHVRHLPISTSLLYLALGFALGPAGFDVLDIDVHAAGRYIERIAEIAVIVSLFIGGLRMRLRVRDPAWRTAFILAGPVMIVSIAAIAALGHLVLDLPFALALLLGAVLAPTDPVLASAVLVNDARDCDRMRYGLSGEAGLNDGMAFPFVVLALSWDQQGGAHGWLFGWVIERIVWAVPAALVLGYLLGALVGRVAIYTRSRDRDTAAPSDFLALALIGLSYVAAETIEAWGFLAVFAAGVGLRAAEVRAVREHPHPDVEAAPDHPPAETLVQAQVEPEALDQPSVAAGVLVFEALSFGDTVERLVEVALIVAVGATLATHWDPRALVVAVVLFAIIRPLVTRFALARTPTSIRQRWLMGWFGIRGIGSLYYLGYALRHGLDGGAARTLVDLTISVVALSILIHGMSAGPVLA